MARRVTQVAVCAVMALIVGCGGGSDADTTAKKSAAPPANAMTDPSDGEAGTAGLVDVRGHKIFMKCRGRGSPTVVYLHGADGEASGADLIAEKLGDRHRFCAYDRPNAMGVSDGVDGPLTGKDSVADLHALLAAADVAGPYVLLGASRGGLLADMYAATYPDDVVGMVLLDALLPADLTIEFRYIPKAQRELKPNVWKQDPEQDDLLTTYRQAQALQGNEPSIPVTYIGVKRFNEFPRSWPQKLISTEVRKSQREFVARFSPGRLVIVDTPHQMESVIPGRIAREVERVIANSTEG